MNIEISKTYNPKEKEENIYCLWEKSGFFNPDNLPGKRKKTFTIIMPPPNANGSLHIGHATFVALQDIMIRYQRMQGKKTLWLPGADHAGFETQVVYDKQLEKQGRSRFQIPRKKLYQEILEFSLKNKKVMEGQLKKLGASCDWSRNKFTLDPKIIKIVYQTFEKLKKDGLLYQGKHIVNWCIKHQTSLSDLEIKHQEQQDPLYYIKYGPFVLATVRPETKFGDTALAVHPKDKRYQKYIGKTIKAQGLLGPFEIKVIADEKVEPDFGTGVIKVTPAHDPNDFEIAQRHNLEIKQVIDFYGRLNEKTGPYQGLKIPEARIKIVADLEKAGLIEKIDYKYKHQVAVCYKCNRIIEPMVLDNQWFVKMSAKPKNSKISLRDLAIKAVKKKQIKFYPQNAEKVFLHWLKNIKDWNISRQIVWGIKIPDKNTEDVFDTWFSSGQWPYATLMTTKPGDFKKFYPTDVMETGPDILFFWVARMVMLGLYVTGKVPFKHIYLHGLIRDKDKQKMSKSKGNIIDPLGIIDLYGSDALRMALVIGNTPGKDSVISEEKIRAYRNFANKIWNASRFVLQQTQNSKRKAQNYNSKLKTKNLTGADKRILNTLNKTIKSVTKDLDNFKFYQASHTLYHFFWHNFCDIYLEQSKKQLENSETKNQTLNILLYVLLTSLKLLHPFMPFITEEIYQKLPLKNKKKCLMIEQWPNLKT
ncbi:MAG: class I tRNA ligase family protein [Candidatus Pacebacteria bacterium]|nr:class I tRNA ligase family protein [Candidatus Paceibacterota bacterium]